MFLLSLDKRCIWPLQPSLELWLKKTVANKWHTCVNGRIQSFPFSKISWSCNCNFIIHVSYVYCRWLMSNSGNYRERAWRSSYREMKWRLPADSWLRRFSWVDIDFFLNIRYQGYDCGKSKLFIQQHKAMFNIIVLFQGECNFKNCLSYC